MLILISPAKTLDYQSALATERYTQPELLDHSQQLIREAFGAANCQPDGDQR